MTSSDWIEPTGPGGQRLALVLAALATGPVWYALSRTTTYDPATYAPLTGYAASHFTWLLLALLTAGALVAAVRAPRRTWLAPVAALALVAGIVTVRLAVQQHTPADPPVATRPTVGDCRNSGIGVGCAAHRALDAVERFTARRTSLADLRRPLNVATGVSIALLALVAITTTVAARRRDVRAA